MTLLSRQICKTGERKTGHNTGFASGGVTCKLGALCLYSSSVLVTVLCSETRPNAKPETVSSYLKQRTTQIMTMKANYFHYEVIESNIDFLYMRLKITMGKILKLVEDENDFKGFYNPIKEIIIECDSIKEFVKFQSLTKGLNNHLYYNSLILSSYSIFEHSLKLVCFFVDNHFALPKKFIDEPRDILGNCIRYLKSTQLVDFKEKEIDKRYIEIKKVNKFRNLIAHHNGNLKKDYKHPLEKQPNYNLFKSDKRLIIIDNGQVYIDNSDYISTFVDNSEIFLKSIIEKIKNNC